MCHNPNLQIDLSLDILEHYCNLNDLTILRLSNNSLSLTKTLTYEMYCYSQTGNVRKKHILFTDEQTLNLRCSVVPKLKNTTIFICFFMWILYKSQMGLNTIGHFFTKARRVLINAFSKQRIQIVSYSIC